MSEDNYTNLWNGDKSVFIDWMNNCLAQIEDEVGGDVADYVFVLIE